MADNIIPMPVSPEMKSQYWPNTGQQENTNANLPIDGRYWPNVGQQDQYCQRETNIGPIHGFCLR